jgi:serine/threonine protein kinase
MKTLSSNEWEQLMSRGEILETSSSLGPKVSRQPDGDFIKILRVKRRLSSSGLMNPAKRFARNASKLETLGIPTVSIRELYKLPHKRCYAVRYAGIEGTTLRDLAEQGKLDEQLLRKFAEFIAHLHNNNIYFRGLHLGNVVLTPDGELGLIDILDCRFLPVLLNYHRQRNLQVIFRYKEAAPYKDQLTRFYQQVT